jgi:2-methylcitrate dehydratase
MRIPIVEGRNGVGVELAHRLADYALSTRYADLDGRSVNEMKARIVDAFGCALGAFNEKPTSMARRAVMGLRRGGPSTILGTRTNTSPDLATFVNGMMVRYFDFNDTYLSKEPAHPSDNVAPCFAVAEAEDVTGRDLITAAVTAYEIQCRLCDAADLRHRGWDHVNYGLVSSALASSKLMRLDAVKATHAVNIALNGHIAMRQVRAGELSMWKGASFANAARNGVFAAILAREGFTGPAPIFEGEMGFFKQVSGEFALDTGKFGGRRGDFKVKGTYVKYWPAEYHAQSAIWAAIEARKHLEDPSDVESVLVETHEAGYTILGKDSEKWEPKTRETADHSLPYIVGMAILKGKIDNSTYSADNLSDRRNLDFMSKIRVVEDPGFTAMYPDGGMPNRITMELKGGKEVAAQVLVPKGHPLNPMSKEDIEAKFLKLAGGPLGERGAKSVLRRLWKLEGEKELGEVLAMMSARKGSNA